VAILGEQREHLGDDEFERRYGILQHLGIPPERSMAQTWRTKAG
jgi:hypothetical protein